MLLMEISFVPKVSFKMKKANGSALTWYQENMKLEKKQQIIQAVYALLAQSLMKKA